MTQHLASPPDPAVRTYEALMLLDADWPRIVGPEIAKRTHPTRLIDRTLQITTPSESWSQQLAFLSDHILRAIAGELPRVDVARLCFRVGRLPE